MAAANVDLISNKACTEKADMIIIKVSKGQT